MSFVKLCLLIVCTFAAVHASPKLRESLDEQLVELVGEIFKEKMDQQLHQLQTKNDELMAELASQKVQMDSLVQALQKERGLFNRNRVHPSEGRSGAPFRTCHETHLSDLSLGSGMYWIDPDGHGIGDDPIYVYCDMTSGATSILHDSEEMIDVGHCLDPGCYSKSITYSATSKQIKTLVDLSAECQQPIRYDCNNAPFYFDSLTYSWWNDRDGKQQSFWSGSGSTSHTCQCGIDGNCVDVHLPCNCDALIPLPLSDIGVITNKNYLPISRLNFGRTQLSTSSGQHTLGRLTCSGSIAVNRMPTSCEDLWRIGHTLSGLYLIKAEKSTDTVYCNFAKQLTDSDFQTWLGTNVTKTPPSVYFEMQRTYDKGTRGILTYDLSRVNIGEGMDPSTGIFTAPLSGTYFFSYSGYSRFEGKRTTGLNVELKINGNQEGLVSYNINKDDHEGDSASVHTIVQLKQGDRVWMEVTSVNQAYLEDSSGRYTHFSGALLLPEDN